MFQDFKDLLSALNAHKVKYLIVGGQAVIRYSQPRATKDLDVLIQPAAKNGAALFRALKDFGAPLGNLSAADFIEKGTFFTIGLPPVAIDILPEIKGVAFAAAWKNRKTEIIDPASRLTAHFISRADLITAKLAAGRLQDLADVEAIRAAADAAPETLKKSKKRKPIRKKTSQVRGWQSLEIRRAAACNNRSLPRPLCRHPRRAGGRSEDDGLRSGRTYAEAPRAVWASVGSEARASLAPANSTQLNTSPITKLIQLRPQTSKRQYALLPEGGEKSAREILIPEQFQCPAQNAGLGLKVNFEK